MIEEELGDLFFTIINLSRRLNLDPEQTIRKLIKNLLPDLMKWKTLLKTTN